MLIAGALGVGALGAYAFFIEPRWLQVTRTRVYIQDLPTFFEGIRIALLSDLHANDRRSLPLIRPACRLSMAEHPDVIALTGDSAEADQRGSAACSMRLPIWRLPSASSPCPATTTTSWESDGGTSR